MKPDEAKLLLIKHGFIKSKYKDQYSVDKKSGFYIHNTGATDPNHADMEEAEEANMTSGSTFSRYLPTGYPTPKRRYRMMIESPTASIEETYFWILNHFRYDTAFHHVEKVVDIFSASEQSSSWGATQQRMGIQQDRVGQYLKGISEMVKQLFQLVRELRILDEKLVPRDEWGKNKAADVALKGEYTDLVENKGGQMQPGSIFHLAQTVGYASLPDLFFNTQVYSLSDIDKKVDAMKFNENIKQVLRRKLYAFINWKIRSDEELKNRKRFTLRYLRQHWNSIKMTMNWVKPYLKNISRLQMSEEHIESPDIITSFETSMTDIELLAHKETKGTHRSCALCTFKFRTRPDLSFQKDSYAHKGPIHVGRVEVTFRAYAWSEKQIDAYKKMKREEDLQLLGLIDENVKAAMESLGEELERYLAEAEEKEFQDKIKIREEDAKKELKELQRMHGPGMLDPFISVFKGLADMATMFIPMPAKKEKKEAKDTSGDAAKDAAGSIFTIYKNYKKSHGMIAW